jgi:uncharacterized membrane protein YwzB
MGEGSQNLGIILDSKNQSNMKLVFLCFIVTYLRSNFLLKFHEIVARHNYLTDNI